MAHFGPPLDLGQIKRPLAPLQRPPVRLASERASKRARNRYQPTTKTTADSDAAGPPRTRRPCPAPFKMFGGRPGPLLWTLFCPTAAQLPPGTRPQWSGARAPIGASAREALRRARPRRVAQSSGARSLIEFAARLLGPLNQLPAFGPSRPAAPDSGRGWGPESPPLIIIKSVWRLCGLEVNRRKQAAPIGAAQLFSLARPNRPIG